MIKEGIKKAKREKDVSRNKAMTWMVVAKNDLSLKNSFSQNELMFQRNPFLPSLMGENSLSSLERGGVLEGGL